MLFVVQRTALALRAAVFRTTARPLELQVARRSVISASTATTFDENQGKSQTKEIGIGASSLPRPPSTPSSSSDLTFDNIEEAFRSKTTLEVFRAYLVFTLCSSAYLVENNMKLMRLAEKVLGKRLFKSLMEATFYGHFVAGEDEQAIQPVIQRMRSYGVNVILNYSAEEDVTAHKPNSATDEAHLDRNVDIFLRCIEAVSSTTQGTGFAAIKMTALGKPQLLVRLTELIKSADQSREFADRTIDVNKTFEPDWIKVENYKTNKAEKLTAALSPQETEMTYKMFNRLDTIFTAARDLDVRVMMDAEQTYFQPAISRLTMELMRKFNREKAIVFNTYQNYLKSTYDNLLRDLEKADSQNFCFGAKLVRGAYLEQERARAKAMGYEDPTNPSYEATTAMYQKSLTECLKRIKASKSKSGEKRVVAMVASNHEDTIRDAVRQMEEYGISPDDKVLCFGQNMGMCDQISFPLGQRGYSVYKYTPFGPVEEVMPYLSRRVHENRGVLAKIQKERRMLLDELKRRLQPKPLSNHYAAY